MGNIRSLDEILDAVTSGEGGKGRKGKKAKPAPVQHLTEEHKARFRGLIQSKKDLKASMDLIKDDTKSIADMIGLKSAQVSEIVKMVIAEETEDGSQLNDKSIVIRFAKEMLGLHDDEDGDSEE